jgi:XTP/dITP diphosphohydrolase
LRLLVATTNPGKVREIRDLLAGLPIELATLASLPPIPAPEETGQTFAENARLKASYYAQRTGELVVAEDSGLEVDAMDGAPGVHSARFGGEESSYAEKFRLIAEALGAVPERPRTARFVCALALADATGVRFEAAGQVDGEIITEPRGEGGFGYDPIFYYPPFGCTLAEAGTRKSEVSHRARAFAQLREFLVAARGSRLAAGG